MDYEYLFMTKSATEPFHCGVHTQPAPHKLYRRRLDLPLTPQPRRLGGLRASQNAGNCVSCSASDLVRNWRAEIVASHWTAVESRKIQEKNRHFRKHRYDIGIVKAEARGPTRSLLSGGPAMWSAPGTPLHDRLQLGFRRRERACGKMAKRKAG